MEKDKRLILIKNDFQSITPLLSVIANENRQNILIVLLENCSSGGIMVDDIAKKVNLSRPAVSHHLKILLLNNIVSITQDGTKNYYHIKSDNELFILKSLISNIEKYIEERKEETL